MTAARVDLTDKHLRGLAPAPVSTRYEIADARLPGLRVRVSDRTRENGRAGSISFVLYDRFPPSTKPTRRTLGSYPAISLADAREMARDWKSEIERGVDPKARMAAEEVSRAEAKSQPKLHTFNAVADQFLAMHVEELQLRSAKEIRRAIDKKVRPEWGDKEIDKIRRRDVTRLLDGVAEDSGPVAADKLLAFLSKIFNWHETREDNFSSPIVRGMNRTRPKDRVRKRNLNDEEIRALWTVAGTADTFGAFIKIVLLTAQRRAKVASMKWADVDENGNWKIPCEPREKGIPGDIMLPAFALDVIRNQPVISENPYVFAGRGCAHISGFSKYKKAFDKSMVEHLGHEIQPWTIHDLRRTAKTLMSSTGVRPDISERVLGHVIPGVEGIYDQFTYRPHRANALRRLARKVRRIVEKHE